MPRRSARRSLCCLRPWGPRRRRAGARGHHARVACRRLGRAERHADRRARPVEGRQRVLGDRRLRAARRHRPAPAADAAEHRARRQARDGHAGRVSARRRPSTTPVAPRADRGRRGLQELRLPGLVGRADLQARRHLLGRHLRTRRAPQQLGVRPGAAGHYHGEGAHAITLNTPASRATCSRSTTSRAPDAERRRRLRPLRRERPGATRRRSCRASATTAPDAAELGNATPDPTRCQLAPLDLHVAGRRRRATW